MGGISGTLPSAVTIGERTPRAIDGYYGENPRAAAHRRPFDWEPGRLDAPTAAKMGGRPVVRQVPVPGIQGGPN